MNKLSIVFLMLVLLATGGMAQSLVVTSVTPSQGAVGSTVTINGSGFGIQLTDQIIYFGAVRAFDIVSQSTTHITLKVPAGATYAPISVLKWYTGQCVLSPRPFNVTFGSGSTRPLDNSTYVAATPIDVNAQNAGIAFGDINQDLFKADMVVTDQFNDKVYLYRNTSTTGTNTFAAPIELSTGATPRAVTLADIDNDGDLDILVANYQGNSISIFTNKITTGSSEWWPQKFERTDFTTGARPSDIDVQDVDGDGRLDVVVVNSWVPSVSVYRNTNTAMNVIDANSLAAPVDFGMNGANALALDDMDGDGKPDMIVANYGTNDIAYRRNTSSPGNISFDYMNDTSIPGDAYDVKTADLDGDGKPDVVIGQSGGAVSILHNASTLGNIVFDTRTDLPMPAEPRYVAISDLNGDGKPDIVTANTNPNDNTGTVSLFQNISSSGSLTAGSFSSAVTLPARNANFSVAVANIDNDGQPDIAALDIGRVTLFRNALDFAAPAVPSGLASATGNTQNALTWSVNTESDLVSYKVYGGTSSNPTTLLQTVNAPAASYLHTGLTNNVVYYYRISAVDASGNESAVTADITATPVMVTAPSITSMSTFKGNVGSPVTISGTGFNATAALSNVYFGATQATVTSASATQLVVTVPAGATYHPVTVTNLTNGLSASSSKPFDVTLLTGTGQAFSSEALARSIDYGWDNVYAAATGDLDNDGKPDMVVSRLLTSNDGLSLLKNISATGTLTGSSFASSVNLQIPPSGVHVYQLAIADIDGDGRQDIIASVHGTYTGFFVYRNTSNSIQANAFIRSYIETGSFTKALAVGDIDGDGRKDIVVSDASNTDGIFVCRNTSSPGAVSFENERIGGLVTEVENIVLNDLDGDGKPEVITVQPGSDSFSVLRNTASSGSLTASSFDARVDVSTGTDTNPRNIAAADIDGDGKADVVVANKDTKTVSVYRNTSSPGSITAGAFSKTDFTTGLGGPVSVAVADLDGDGKPDVAAHSTGYDPNIGEDVFYLSIFRNVSSPGSITTASLQARRDFATASEGAGLVIGDLDADGPPDIVLSHLWTLSVYHNVMDFTPPAVPPVVVVPGNAKNTLSWQPDGEEDVVYKVYGGTTPGANVLLATIEHPQTLFVHTGLTNGTVYYYHVTAADANGNVSNASAEISATPANSAVPSIVQVTPASGNPGSAVTITGAHFGATPANNIVHFGSIRANVTSASATQLTVTVPAGASYAPVSILNTATGLTGSSPVSFAPTFGPERDVNFNESTFGSPVDLQLQAAPWATLAGDIDGDGKPDMVAVNHNNHSVSLYRNISVTGTVSESSFADPVEVSTVDHPTAAALADLDNDGKLDLIVAHSDYVHLIYIYRNTASAGELTAGSFAAPVTFDTGSPAFALAIGDIDGDGKRDIAVVHHAGNNDVAVIRNLSSPGSMAAGDFEHGVSLVPGGASRGATLADLDGDGALDLAVAHGNSFSVYRNTATVGSITNASFAAQASFSVTRPSGIVTGDLDRDGKQDVVVISDTSPNVVVFHNTASQGSLTTSSFASGFNLPMHSHESSPDIAVGDIDGDGRQDLVVAVSGDPHKIRAFRNISEPGAMDNNSFADIEFDLGYTNTPTSIILSDVDGDGPPDLLWTTSSATFASRNTVDFTPPATPQNVTATGGDATITIRLTPNTEEDLASYHVSGGTTSGDNEGMGTFDATEDSFIMTSPGEGPLLNGTTYYIKVAAVDTYGNKSAYTTEIAVTPNMPLSPVITEVTPGSAVSGTSVTIIGQNFNITPASNLVRFGVTKAEVTQASATQLKVTVPVSATYGAVSVLDAETGRSATSPIPFAGKIGAGMGQDLTESSFDPAIKIENTPFITGMAMGDIDGDGKPDLAATNYTSDPPTVSVYRNTSASGSITANSFAEPVTFTTGYGPWSVAIADLDNDGKQDLIVSNADDYSVSIYRNTSTAGSIDGDSFAAPEVIGADQWVNGLSIADIDVDGKPDIILSTEDGIFVHRNRAMPGHISADDLGDYIRVGDHITYRGLAVGDLDGDGKPEIIGTDYYANTVLVYQNLTTRGNISEESFAPPIAFGTGDGPTPVSIADIDRDGKSDIVVGASSANVISILRNTSSVGTIDESSFAQKVDIVSTNRTTSLAIDDLDADGRPDIAAINKNLYEITVFRNLSAPGSIAEESFGPAVDISMGSIEDSYAILLGDLDGDGRSDMIVPNGTENEIQIFRNAMDLAAPAVPVNLSATAGENDIVLTWDANTDTNLAAYKVYGGTTPGPTTLLTTIDVPNTTYTHEGVDHGTMYYYRIAAVKTFGYESEKTADVRAAIRVNTTITFPVLEPVAYGVADFVPGATSTNTTTPIQYASSNSSVATIVDGKIHITGVGTTVITASQPQDDLHFAAADVTRELVVSKGSQTITFSAPEDKNMGDAAFTLTATSTAGLSVSFSSTTSDLVNITGNTVTLLKPGRANITASQPGDDRYLAATPITHSFCIVPARPAVTLNLDNPETPVLTSTAASGNQWYLNGTAIEGATNASYTVAAQGLYTVKVTADDCASDMSVAMPIIITGALPAEAAATLEVYPNPAAEKINIRIPGKGAKRILITSQEGKVVYNHEVAAEEVTVDVTHYAGGVYAISASSQRGSEIIRFVKK